VIRSYFVVIDTIRIHIK